MKRVNDIIVQALQAEKDKLLSRLKEMEKLLKGDYTSRIFMAFDEFDAEKDIVKKGNILKKIKRLEVANKKQMDAMVSEAFMDERIEIKLLLQDIDAELWYREKHYKNEEL